MDYITLALAKDYADQVAAGGGSGSADLKNYYKKSEVDNKLNEKVDKIEGKSLSTNDYTTEEKTKLASLENYNDEEIKASIALKADTENVYSKTEIDERTSLISGYKGTVANESKLPTENLVNGDVYRLEDTNTNVMYKSETYSISNGSKIKTITFPEEVVYDENVDGKTIEFKSEDGTVLYTCTYQDKINYLSRFVTLTCGDLFTVVYTKEVGTETFGKIDGNDTYTFDAELNVNSTFDSNIPFVSICNKGWETLSSDMNLSAYYTKPELESLRGFPFLQKVWYDVNKNSITTTDPKNNEIGYYSVALGDNTFAEGIRSFAMGAHSRATGDYSIAMGNQARTNTDNGCAIGEYVMTQAKNQTALGCYNKIDSDNLFIIGNGTNESSRSNAHTLSKNGIAWFEGDIYTGSTSGTNKDEGSVRLAKITELNTKVDKVEGKDLSSNDFTDDLKTKLEGLSNYNESELKASIENKVDKITGKGLSTEDYTSEEKTKLAGLSNYNDTEIKTSLNSKANSADVYTKSEVDNKVSSIYKYKGSVANKEALPTENLAIGDVYNLEDTGMNVAYTGEKWDELGANIDLSSYYTKTEVNELPLIKGLKYNTTKNSLYTNAIGQSATASGYHSIALGPLARAKGNRSVAIGHDCHADKDYSTAIGYEAIANGTNSVAVGDGAVANGDNQIALGQFNAGDEINLLVIGNGTSSTTRSNAHTLSKKGVAWFKGDIYTGGTSISGATKLAKVTELDAKVDKVEGKGLSTNDFTDDLNTKLAGIATGAEVNIINTVKLNGEALTVTDKSVNIEVPIPQMQSCDVPYDAGNLPISVVNGANGFTQNQKSFSAIASSGTTYETTITVNKENISTIVLSASLAQHNSNNQTSTKFIETGCVAKIEFLYQGQSQTIKEVSTIGQSVLIEGAINGMQIKLTLQCSDNSKNVMFKVNIENYCINETLNNTLTISDSGDMYLQNILKQKTAELQTQIDWINNDTSKDMQVVPLYDTQASANLTMLNNTEYRIETHSGTSTLNINFEEGFETVDTATYKSVLILRTGTNDNDSCTVTVPDGVILQGDNVTNNTLTTQKLKVYEISFNWHGFMMVGLVKGFSYPAPLA